MNRNVGIQNQGLVAWPGGTGPGTPRDIRRHTDFGFVFEVTAALAADTIFAVKAHDPSPTDNCVPGAARDVPEIALCDNTVQPAANSQILIPAGTPVGSICAATIPCRPGAFVSLAAVSGDTADIVATVVLSGPMF